MGLLFSSEITRSDVIQLTMSFQQMSEKIDIYVPWISFFRNGGVTLSLIGAVNMFLKSVTLYSLGDDVAAQLILIGLLMQILGSFGLQETAIVFPLKELLDQFFKTVPSYTDTSHMPKLLADLEIVILPIVLFNMYSFMVCQDMKEFSFWSVLVSITLLGLNGSLLRRIIRNKTEADLKIICRICSKTLTEMLQANADP